jgi:hypothetical protein
LLFSLTWVEITALYSTLLGEMKETHFVKMSGQRDFYLISGVEKTGFFPDQIMHDPIRWTNRIASRAWLV